MRQPVLCGEGRKGLPIITAHTPYSSEPEMTILVLGEKWVVSLVDIAADILSSSQDVSLRLTSQYDGLRPEQRFWLVVLVCGELSPR